MSEWSILKCDGCRDEVMESGYARVELPQGWSRIDTEDYCSACSKDDDETSRAPDAERTEGE